MTDIRRLPTTEDRLPAASELDRLATVDFVALMNAEDARVAAAVARESERVADAIDRIAARLAAGGRLLYVGAGTSGRLGVLDASECPPTFSSPPGQVVGVIAGGPTAVTAAVEGAEDDASAGAADLIRLQVSDADAVVGIAASGRTPYVLGALDHARSLGALTIAVACVAASSLSRAAELAIEPVVGPEVVSGSTRLKAGTATKLVLNQLSTGAMVRLGKTYGDLMVDLRASNVKLRARAARILGRLTGLETDRARDVLDRCGGDLKVAIVCERLGLEQDAAALRLEAAGGRLRDVIDGN